MNKIKHNKFKNSGIIFELLIRQITSDTLSGKDSLALNLVKKYFSKGELAKEHKLYQTLINTKALSEGKAESLINITLELSSKLNRTLLRKEKYNLIKEIRDVYNIEEFFKAKVNNYKEYAAACTLIEVHNSLEFTNPNQIIENKITLLEHISRNDIDKEKTSDRLMEEFVGMDKGMRLLTYKTLLERFNSKYSNLSDRQKLVLKEYINNISSTVKLREFVNDNFKVIKLELTRLNKTVTDQTTKIKINEVVNMVKPIEKTQNVKDENLVSLLQHYQLIDELKTIK
jgi:hypothetical protein